MRRSAVKVSRRQLLLTCSGLALGAGGCSGGSLLRDSGSGGVAGRLVINPQRAIETTDRGVDTAFLGLSSLRGGDLMAFWGTQDSAGVPTRLTQALFWDTNPAQGVRVLFDGLGLPTRIEQEENGAFVLVFWEESRAVFKFYQAGGQFIGGSEVKGAPGAFTVTQLPGTVVVGYFAGRISGLTDAIINFTIGGNPDTSRATPPAPATRSRQAPPSTLTAAEQAAARSAVAALARIAVGGAGSFAAGLLQEIAVPLLDTGISALGTRIVATALEGTGLAPTFVRDGKAIVQGLAAPYHLQRTAQTLQSALGSDSASFPSQIGVAYSSPPPVYYRADNTFKTTRPESDPTGIRGIAASREYDTVPIVGTIDAEGRLTLSGTATDGTVLEFTGTLVGDSVSGGTWSRRGGPSTRQSSAGGGWGADKTPLGRCTEQQNSGGQGIFSNTYDLGKCGDFPFRYEAFSIPDQFQIFQDNNLLFDTGGKVSGGSTITVTAVGQTSIIRVVVTADLSGTAWNYTVGCPK